MTRNRCDAERFLDWLHSVISGAEDVDVDVIVLDQANERASVQITLYDVEAPLAGLDVQPLR